ncbi:hypothetical protein FRC00_002184 [Tulasnella sp. 408]|nr:hypothetical protein FRC00_002184 [Tulasnella sp. 408]
MAAWTLQGARTRKLKPFLDPQVIEEVANNVVEVKAEAFVRAFLYPSSRLGEEEPLMQRDLELAAACHDMLKQKVSKDDALTAILTSPSCPQYSKAVFTLLDPNVMDEEDLYTPFRTLFTFINAFYRISFANRSLPHDIDAAWPAAFDPKAGDLEDTRTLTEPVLRNFFDTRKSTLKFSPRLKGEPAHLKPDLVLMAHRDKDPNTKQPSVHWKDVRVPIEIKRNFKREGKIVSQLALYVHAMLMEQFDRNFALTVSLSATQCRLFHWDSVGCHATEPINIHDDPILFIRCIARLAMMTPAELGYDERFSNAGRILSDEKLTTTLTVHESPVRQYLDREPSPDERPLETATSMLLELDTENFLFESRGGIFHQYTRVWRGKEISDVKIWETGPTRVVKQSWAEDFRPSEGYLYKLTNNIPTVCSLVLMEECDHTWEYHNRVAEQDVIGYLKAAEPKPDLQPAVRQLEGDLLTLGPNPRQFANIANRGSPTPLNTSSGQVESPERVLLRFVLEEEYRPLHKANNSSEVLKATVQWIEGLIALDAVGPETNAPTPAKIIDLGFAHLKEVQSGDEPLSRTPETPSVCQEAFSSKGRTLTSGGDSTPPILRDDHSLTGTPPFVALDLMEQHQYSPTSSFVEHGLHHDVESVFWVLIYLCHVKADPEPADPMGSILRGLTSPDIDFVISTMSSIVGRGRKFLTEIVGPFYGLRDFLKDFADYHHACSEREEPIDVFKVLAMAIEHRDKLAKREKEYASSATVQQLPPMTTLGSTATFDSPKRKLFTLKDSSRPSEREEELFEEGVSTSKKKTKHDTSVNSLMQT